MLRISAICVNVGAILVLIFLLSTEPPPRTGQDWLLVFLFFVVPSLSLWALLAANSLGESWFALYLRRKAAEEKAKLAELEAAANKARTQ